MLRGNNPIWMIVIAGLLVSAAGCSDDNSTEPTGTPGNPLTLPLDVGNRWEYRVSETTDDGTDEYTVVDEITGTTELDGQTYSVIRSIESQVSGWADTTVSYMRQVGQKLYSYEMEDSSGIGSNEYLIFMYESLMDSQPWMVAEFTSYSGTSWSALDIEKSWTLDGGGTRVLRLKVTPGNDGRTEITVPAGTYDDVYIGGLIREFILVENAPPLPPIGQVFSAEQTFHVKDGVGVVKVEVVAKQRIGDTQPETLSTIVMELTAFEVQP